MNVKLKLVAGINVSNTFQTLKSISNTDVLIISINSKEYMNIEIHSEIRKRVQILTKLLDINENQIEVPQMNYDNNNTNVIFRFSKNMQRYV